MRRQSSLPAWRASCPPRRAATPSASPSTRLCACKETGEAKTIVFGLTGTGYFDMVAYEKFHDGKMTDYIPTDDDLRASIERLPKVDK